MSAERSSLLGAGLIYMIANVMAAAIPFLLLPVLTAALDVDEYGQTVNFFALVSLCTATAGLSLHGAIGTRWFTRDNLDFGSFTTTCLLTIAASTIVTAGIVVLACRLLRIDLGLSDAWIAAAAITAGANAMLNARLVLWQSQRLPLFAAALQVTYAILAMTLSIIGVLWLGLKASGRMGGALLASVLIAAVAVGFFVSRGDANGRPSKANLMAALRFGAPLIPHVLAGVVMVTIDRIVVAALLGAAAVGTYGVAAQLGMAMTVLGDAFCKSYGPWMYERLGRGEERDRYAVVGATWLAVPAFLGIGAIVGTALQIVVPWVIDAKYVSAMPLVWWFVLGGAFNGMYLSVAGFFFFSSRTEYVSIVTGTSAVAGAVLCYLLVKSLGPLGGGIAYTTTQAIAFMVALTLARRLSNGLPWREGRTAMRVAIQELR